MQCLTRKHWRGPVSRPRLVRKAEGNFSGTVTASAVVASENFTASVATFQGDVYLTGETRIYGANAKLNFYSIVGGTLTSHGGIRGDNRTLLISGGNNGVQVASHGSLDKLGFYGATPIARPSSVAVNVSAIHSALVSLGLIT